MAIRHARRRHHWQGLKIAAFIACFAATPASAQIYPGGGVTSYPGAIGGSTDQVVPYGPGFDKGVIVGPGANRCVAGACTDLTNRPAHRRTYGHYFDVPRPGYRKPVREGRIPLQAAPDHLSWCAERYRSYRAADNSWKPSSGPRRTCISPFR